MKKTTIFLPMLILVAALLMSACSGVSVQIPGLASGAPVASASGGQLAVNSSPVSAPVAQAGSDIEVLAAYQQTLENIYQQVNPSVVNIRVVQKANAVSTDLNQLMPFFNNPDTNPQNPNNPQSQNPPTSQALGSGFVWDTAGHIITNNHVVDGAEKIEVRFSSGKTVTASLVGADPDSDLAVIKVDVPADQLVPVKVADSNQVKVGQLAIAIGNPFGLEGTMTAGIVSALDRSLPANSEGLSAGPTYTIPEIIQTDAAINPGNSGGVLLNSNGEVIGVTAAIESTAGSNAGVGFVIPSSIVKTVVPELITNGKYQHPWIGISAATLTPDLSTAAGLNADQQGVMIAEVMANSPAEKAGLQGSTRQATIDGQNVNVGGDVITAVDGQPIKEMDDLIAYLASNTTIGQKIVLSVLRDNQQISVDVTLASRPTTNEATAVQAPAQSAPQQQAPQQQAPENQTPQGQTPQNQEPQGQVPQSSGKAYLGVSVIPVTPDIASQMNLSSGQGGVLVVQVQPGSAAALAGLKVGSTPYTLDGQSVMIGGDIITAVNGQAVNTLDDLRNAMAQFNPGETVTLSVLRDNQTIELSAILGIRPNQ
jgi:serine protease Do